MGKLSLFVVSFSDGQRVYHPGQVVQGQVTIELTDTMKMRGVHIKFLGKANVHWTTKITSGSGNKARRTKHYTASETYFEQEIVLAGRWKNQAGEDIHLPAGRHSYPFAIQLPPDLPSSFEGLHGHVRYTVKATIDKPWQFDHVTKKVFTVVSALDLNKEPKAFKPGQGTVSKNFCCCSSGQVSATLILNRRGYVPGETIFIKAEIDNKSSRKMCGSSVAMYMTAIFHANHETKRSIRTVANISHGKIEKGETDYWNGDQLVIPPLPPSFLLGCSIIDIRYTLELQVEPSGLSFSLEVPLDIIVGTVPLQHATAPLERTVVMSGSSNVPNPGRHRHPKTEVYAIEEDLPSAWTDSGDQYDIPDYPPPSYAECVFGKVKIKADDDTDDYSGDTDFTPVYTYYDWGYMPSGRL